MDKTRKNINIAEPSFSSEDRKVIHKEIDNILSNKLSMGENVTKFEQEFSSYTNSKYAIAVNSCTSALEVALKGLGVSEGDEVIVPCQTFIATGMSVHLVGGIPVFCEISKKDFCLDFQHMKQLVTKKTRGVILVHFVGLISEDIFKIKNFCEENNLFLIEDAAHAPGASINNIQAGTIGDAGCFSFFPTKVITAGEGGMLTTNNDQLYNFSRSLQNRGLDMQSDKERYSYPGRNIRMTEMTAITGRVQLGHLDDYLERRRLIAGMYTEYFLKNKLITVLLPSKDSSPSFWKYPILLNQNIDREKVLADLHKEKIFADLTYQPALHLQPVFQDILGTSVGDLPKSENILKQHICLPCHQNMTIDDAKFVIKILTLSLKKNSQVGS